MKNQTPLPVNVQVDERRIARTVADHAQAADSIQLKDELESDQDYKAHGELLSGLRTTVKDMTAQRDSMTKPLKDVVKRLTEMYKPTLDSLARLEGGVKRLMLDYRAKEEARKALLHAETQRLLASKSKAKQREAIGIVAEINEEEPRARGTSVRKVWRAVIKDESKVPREFWVVDERAVRADAVARGWSDPPPGVEYVQEDTMAVTGGRS